MYYFCVINTNIYLNNMIKHVLTFLLFLQFCMSSYAQIERKREFVNFDQGGAFIHNFFQDERGIVWLCTSNGLSMFDGRGVSKRNVSGSNEDLKGVFIYCSLKQDETHYYLGTEKGLYLFDLEGDTCRLLSSSALSVRTIRQVNDSIILLGTLNGLIKYDLKQDAFRTVEKLPESPVNPIVRLDDTHFFITNHSGLYLYDAIADNYQLLPFSSPKFPLILSIAVDSSNQWAWIGTESGLWKYDIASGEFMKNTSLPDAPIKNIHISSSDGLLWIGTDNGLYIYDWQLNDLEHIVHSSKDTNSLVNNIIWSIFEDRDGNIWLGTGSGISLYYNSRVVETYSWDSLVRSDEGNDIYCMYRDSRNNFWWGGSNGLCYYNPVRNKSLWFKMNQGKHSISHNRIRWIYEDWDKDLWIATDGGINRFDYATETFENYLITDSTHTRNANWAYYINSDNRAHLYIVAYSGGVFVVDKKKLLAHRGKVYVADENYHHHSESNGLRSNFVSLATMDADGCLWVPSEEHYLDRIDFKEKKVYSYDLLEKEPDLSNESIRKIIHDKEGNLWLAMTTCLCKITVGNQKIEVIRDPVFENKEIQMLEDAGDKLWIGTSDGIYAYDKMTGKFVYSGIGTSWISLYNDPYAHKIWVGGIDQCLAFKSDELLKVRKNGGDIILSRLYVNDKPVYAHESLNDHVIATRNINRLELIHLLHNQNNIAFNFLHTRYDGVLKSHYIYRLKGVDNDWRNVEDLGLRISYSNLKPGDYEFELKELVYGDNKDAASFHLNITVDSPWFLTYWAKGIYVLFACLLILWVVNYFKEKNRFRIERIEKEKTLELSDLKMEFLTNMSHELKTPLSLIISPVSKLLAEAKNPQLKETLSLIHTNALKLNSIVHQILTIKDWAGAQQELHLSQLEVVTFIESMVKSYQENWKDKGITIEFQSHVEQCFIEVDIPKIEAIVDNLLSNACKFLRTNGKIKVLLALQENGLEQTKRICLEVADNGVGIPEHDLPHIFDRFYQADKNRAMNSNGSGIGLSLVKANVELHGGEISITSEEGKGTVVSVCLPVVGKSVAGSERESHVVWETDEQRKCKVLIVEDNIDIAHFIMDNLRNAECLVAYNGKMGMEMAQQHSPDIIIADIMMPVMNGIEMAKQLKANIQTSTIPIIMLTAMDDKKTQFDLLAVGAEAFIAKPFEIKELVMHIDRILRNKYRLVRKLKEEGAALKTETVLTESADEKFLNHITEIIEQNLSNSDLNVTKLAELSGYHSKQIYRRVKQLTGCTTVDYIKGIRMKKAAMLLAKKQFMISEVMYMVGFSDSSYFSKCFVEKYGKTPKQYMDSL